MNAFDELPLLVFTLLAQMAAGIIIVGQCAQYGLKMEQNPALVARIRKQSIAALVFIALAAFLSMLHLGTPMHSPFTIFHVGSSWLSREIAGVILFGCCLVVLVWMRAKPAIHPREDIVSWLCALLGLLLVFVMSQVYNTPYMPGWHSVSTAFLFLATALVLGGLWLAMALAFRGFAQTVMASGINNAWGRILFLVFGGYMLMAVFLPAAIPALDLSRINPARLAASHGQLVFWNSLHAALDGLGLLIFLGAIWLAFMRRADITGPAGQGRPIRPAFNPVFLAFVLAILGEACGRFAFYLSYARLGL